MSIFEFIQSLTRRGVTLRLEGDRIVLNPASLLTASDLTMIRGIKPGIIALLQRQRIQRLPIERDDVEDYYPDILTLADGRAVYLQDVLDHAMQASDTDSGDWLDLMHEPVLLAFAASLLACGLMRAVNDD